MDLKPWRVSDTAISHSLHCPMSSPRTWMFRVSASWSQLTFRRISNNHSTNCLQILMPTPQCCPLLFSNISFTHSPPSEKKIWLYMHSNHTFINETTKKALEITIMCISKFGVVDKTWEVDHFKIKLTVTMIWKAFCSNNKMTKWKHDSPSIQALCCDYSLTSYETRRRPLVTLIHFLQ